MRQMRNISLGLLALLFMGFIGCAHVYTAHGIMYRVKNGDTMDSIAKKYHVDLQELAEVNNIESQTDLKTGRALYIPGVTPSSLAVLISEHQKGSKKVNKEEKKVAEKEKNQKKEKKGKKGEEKSSETKPSEIEVEHGRFAWPLEGEISSGFGIRGKRRHDGLDIRSPMGTPIKAAADGEVVFSKTMRGYGKLVIVKHENDFFTVYAHTSQNLVKQGEKVKRGQLIAKVGRTGRATGPHLHFEIREGAKARNPLFFLPKNQFYEQGRQKGVDDGNESEEHSGESEGENP